jgi:hypothetical protein
MNFIHSCREKDISGKPPLETCGRNSRLTHNRLFPGRRCCCDVAYLCQAFSQHTGPGAITDKSGRHFVARYPSQRSTESNHELNSNSVTDVLTYKCYRCPDCALRRRTSNAEPRTLL